MIFYFRTWCCPFHEMGKWLAYFVTWAKFLPISQKRAISWIGRNIYIVIVIVIYKHQTYAQLLSTDFILVVNVVVSILLRQGTFLAISSLQELRLGNNFLRISDWGISQSTLEDVFTRICVSWLFSFFYYTKLLIML